MQNIFYDTRILDSECRTNYSLSEECMMENAAVGLEEAVLQKDCHHVFIFCGGGNNGADGYALARRLSCLREVRTITVATPKSELCRLQCERAKKCKVPALSLKEFKESALPKNEECIFVDCIFGTGFHGSLDEECAALVRMLNKCRAYKIACDVPSGLALDGSINGETFRSDTTVCMGSLKTCLFSDAAKDFAGRLTVKDLGVSRTLFETCSQKPDALLLEEKDLSLPHRKMQNVNKGSFGHVACLAGEKPGAAVIAASAALQFGAGLVTIVSPSEQGNINSVPYEIMQSGEFPQNTSTIALGMGLGHDEDRIKKIYAFLEARPELSCVLDADICYTKLTSRFLHSRISSAGGTVITPHPKEFSALLSVCGLGDYSVNEVAQQRFDLVRKFCSEFPNVVLVLKGANVLVACKKEKGDILIFVNDKGSPSLGKAGSGDVLTGLTAALLAQKQEALTAAKNASLAHALASRLVQPDYSLTPFKLIDAVSALSETYPEK